MREWLIKQRRNQHLTQDNIAQQVGVTRQLISAIEHDANPSIKTAKSIASALNIDWQLFYEKNIE
jgi:DNA-binding XRE family transcriptional regulator